MAPSPVGLIGGLYTVDFGRKLDAAADPLTRFAASGGGQTNATAIQVSRGWPARARVLSALAGPPARNLLSPLAHGTARTPSGEMGYFVICPGAPGPSLLATSRPWSETELVEHVVKPVAMVLAALQAKGVTHRGIRPSNLFQSVPNTPVTLGAAWAAPPASHQPSWIEPPYSAACLPTGRGDGTIADDVYALGAVLLMLAVGANPVATIPDDELIDRKLDLGSYAALAGKHRVPAALAELIRGMLADDPEHRPSPSLLATPVAARARRIAARPIRRAQRPTEIAGRPVSTARTLAYTLQREPKLGLAALRDGSIDLWLKRGLGDLVAAAQLEEAVRLRDNQVAGGDNRADPMLVAQAISILDPAAPLVWRSVALWPDGLGPALDHALHHAPDQTAVFTELATTQIIETWVKRRSAGRETPPKTNDYDLRNLLPSDRASAKAVQLAYSLNLLAPCDSPLIYRFWATRMSDLLPSMEEAAPTMPPGSKALIDSHIAAFIAARRDERLHGDIGRLANTLPPGDILAQTQILARMQIKLHVDAVPNLTGWAAEALQPLIQHYRSRNRRTELATSMAALGKAGQLPPMAALLEDEELRTKDDQGCSHAADRLALIERALDAMMSDEIGQAHHARQIGRDVAGGVGLLACIASIAFAVFG